MVKDFCVNLLTDLSLHEVSELEAHSNLGVHTISTCDYSSFIYEVYIMYIYSIYNIYVYTQENMFQYKYSAYFIYGRVYLGI